MTKKKKGILIFTIVISALVGLYVLKSVLKENTKPLPESEGVFEVDSSSVGSVTSYGLPAMIDFGSESCTACRQMAPVLRKLNCEWQGKAVVLFHDVWKYPNRFREFPVQVIPTQFFFYEDGSPYNPSPEVIKKCRFIRYTDKKTGQHRLTAHQGALSEEEIRMIFDDLFSGR